MKTLDVSHNRVYSLNLRHHYNVKKVIESLKNEEEVSILTPKEKFITFLDFEYPTSLISLDMPPTCLFYEGNKELLKMPAIGIIGSRRNSEYGHMMTMELMRHIPKEYCIVSGMAAGIDGIAQRSAIFNGHKTIGVIGSGLDYIYPKENADLYKEVKKNHLLISEYVHSEPIERYHFLERNRIIAGLSDILIVIESKLHSGTSTTVTQMLELGKDVYVIPHNLTNENGKGNLKMIEDGANVIWDLEEFSKMLKNDLTKF